MFKSSALAALLLGLIANTLASGSQPTCGPGSNCPNSAPCCSTYGQCGVGAYCLGGCDPRYSFSLKSCVPAPVCNSQNFEMKDTSDIVDISAYLGDSSKGNWVSSGKPVAYNGDGILLTMAADTVGTLMSSINYVWYGKISATLLTSAGQGVVTAFILMSDSKDEIDYEFVGVDLQHAQTNYYSQGNLVYTNSANVSAPNTHTESHVYTLDWSPDTLTWSVDGNVLRTTHRADTWNSTSNRYDYPQTPSRIELSLWPAGLPSNAEGTIEWAGGVIDWSSPDMTNGYYYALFSAVSVECYNPPPGAQVSGTKSYIYTDRTATNQSIEISNDVVVLGSLYATGDNPGLNPDGTSSISSQASDQPQTVPGVSGIGTRGDLPGGSNNPASGSNSSQGSSSFSQGQDNGAYSIRSSGGSAFAVIVAVICVCFWL